MHKTRGSIKDHTETAHETHLTREALIKNAEVLRLIPDQKRLWIFEALYLSEYISFTNVQGESQEEITLWSSVY